MKYTEDILNKVIQLGILGYGLKKVMNIISPSDRADFARDFDDPNSEIYRSYMKGLDQGELEIDMNLYKLAKEGDMNALEQFNERKRSRMLDEEDRIADELS